MEVPSSVHQVREILQKFPFDPFLVVYFLIFSSGSKGQSAFLSMDNKAIARQMTANEYKLFAAIEFHEFLGQAWSKKGSEWKAPNIQACIRRFNEVLLLLWNRYRLYRDSNFVDISKLTVVLNIFLRERNS